jgi:hypothetical protein
MERGKKYTGLVIIGQHAGFWRLSTLGGEGGTEVINMLGSVRYQHAGVEERLNMLGLQRESICRACEGD